MNTNDMIIEEKVCEFVTKNLMFTSVDIANSIKKDIWIRNSEVASWLRDHFVAKFPVYTMTRIPVMNGQFLANLYYLIGANPDDYQDRNQTALSPTVSSNPQVQQSSTNVCTDEKIISADSQGRVRIPASLVKQLGWNPGDSVDKNRVLVNNEDIPEDLIVQTDGRISFQRKCIAWGNDPVKVFINNNNLCFEKA
jgi:hypothetical protein